MGYHALLQGIFPAQGLKPLNSPALACEFFTTSATWEALRRGEVAKVLGTIFQVPDFKVRATFSN